MFLILPLLLFAMFANGKDLEDFVDCELNLLSLKTANSNDPVHLWQRNNMTLFSGHNIQDVGQFENCRNFSLNNYVLAIIQPNFTQYTSFVGICGPKNCSSSDYNFLYKTFKSEIEEYIPELRSVELNFIDPFKPNLEFDLGFWISISLIAIILIFNILGSFWSKPTKLQHIKDENSLLSTLNDTTIEEIPRNKYIIFIRNFDFRGNYARFLDEINENENSSIKILAGIRAFAFLWIVFAHVCLAAVILSKEPIVVQEYEKKSWMFLFIYAGYYAVDIFFFLSGFFLSLILIKEFTHPRPNIISYLKFFWSRIIRIWPMYIVCLVLFWKLVAFLGSGPIWYMYLDFAGKCDDSFWHNFLFIDNILSSLKEYCMPWAWYLAADFQLFTFGIILVYLWRKNKKLGNSLIFISFWLAILYSFYLAISKEFYYSFPPDVFGNGRYFIDYYINPIVKAPCYLIGIGCGIIYFERFLDQRTNVCHLCKFIQYIAFAVILFLIFYPRVLQVQAQDWPMSIRYIWIVLSRILFTISLAIWLGPMVISRSRDPARKIFEARPIQLISKVSFLGYLIHPIVIAYSFINAGEAKEFTIGVVLSSLIYVNFVTIMLSLILHLSLERPISNLMKSSKKLASN